MSTVAQDVQQIRKAIYGREVREAIADGIEHCYSDVSGGVTTANTAADAAYAAAQRANTAAAGAEGIPGTASLEDVNTLKSALNNKASSNFNTSNFVSDVIDDVFTTTNTSRGWVTTDLISNLPVEPNHTYTQYLGAFDSDAPESFIRIYIMDSNGTEVGRVDINKQRLVNAIVTSANAAKLTVTLFFNNGTPLPGKTSIGVHELFICSGDVEYLYTDPNMRFNGGNGAYGFKIIPHLTINTGNGVISSNVSKGLSDYIPIKTGEYVYFNTTGIIDIALFNTNKEHVSFSRTEAGESSWKIWQANVSYMRFTGDLAVLKETTVVVQPYIIPDYAKQTNQRIAHKPSIIFDRVPIFQKDYEEYEYTAGTHGWFEKLLTSIQVTGGNSYGILIDYYEGFPHENEYVIYIYGEDANDTVIERRTLSRANGNSAVFTANADTVKYDVYMEIDRNTGVTETGTAKIYGFKLYDLGSAKKLVINDFFAIKSDNIIRNVLPDYYDSYLKNKIATIRNYDDVIGTTGDRFIFITDYHDYFTGNSNYSPALIKEIIKNVPISMTVFGGDGVNSADTEAEMKDRLMGFLQRFDGIENFYPIIGNHEFYSDWLNPGDYKGGITKSEVYAYFNKRLERDADAVDGISGFRIDNPVAKIRYYMLGCDYNVGINTETKKWCFNDLRTTPDDYIVIFMAHYALNANASPAVLSGAFTDVHNAIVAAKNSRTFTYDGVTFDYSSLNVAIPLVIGGHTHIDASAVIDGVNYVSVTADNSRSALTESDADDRTPGTVNEQAFDVVSIDRSLKKAYFTRIGGGHDREFSYA